MDMKRILFLVLWSTLFTYNAESFSNESLLKRKSRKIFQNTVLHEKKLGRKDGVYSRPSGAIERGSGFFVPGLEGNRVLWVGGSVLLVAAVLSENATLLSKGVGIVFSLLLLVQASVESKGGETIVSGNKVAASPIKTFKSQWTTRFPDQFRERVVWCARTFLQLTSAAQDMYLIGPGKILFSMGVSDFPGPDKEETACLAALETLSKSTGGRVALPSSHPTFLLFQDPKCVILQRIGSNEMQLAWIVVGEKPLDSFSSNTLSWLGQLATFVEQTD